MENIESQIKQQGLVLAVEASALQVVDQESATRASGIVAGLKDVVSKWKAYWKEPKAKAKAAHSILCEREAELLKRIEPAITYASSRLAAWTMAEREKARKEQEAREKAEWEARQKEQEAASKLDEVIDFEEAAKIAEAARPKAPLPPAPVQPVLDGLQMRDHWVFEVEDLEKVPRHYLMLDQSMVQAEVTRLKDKTDIPGIRVFNNPIMAKARR